MPVEIVRSAGEFRSLIRKQGLTAVDFFADWCGPCKAIAPHWEDLSNQYGHVTFLKVNVDDLQEVAQSEQVAAMPTFVFYKAGREVKRIQGADRHAIQQALEQYGDQPVESAAAREAKEAAATMLERSRKLKQEREAEQRKAREVMQANQNKASASGGTDARKPPEPAPKPKAEAPPPPKPKEPSPISNLQIVLYDGTRTSHVFDATEKLEAVREWVKEAAPDHGDGKFFFKQLVPPRRFTGTDFKATLRKLNLAPSGTLVCVKDLPPPKAKPPPELETGYATVWQLIMCVLNILNPLTWIAAARKAGLMNQAPAKPVEEKKKEAAPKPARKFGAQVRKVGEGGSSFGKRENFDNGNSTAFEG